MFERFTKAAREVVISAKHQAGDLRHSRVGTEHILLALLEVDVDGAAGRALHGAGVEPAAVREEIVRRVGAGPEPLGEADAEALRAIGIDLEAVRDKVEESFGPGALDEPTDDLPAADDIEERGGLVDRLRGRRRRSLPGHIPFAPRCKKVLELSLREAIHLGHRYIGTEHILLGLLREGEGLGVRILVDAGVDLDDLRRRTLAGLGRAA
jgi:ATP-dependent Clp protease ATP-binding subunit ClpA